MKRFERTPLYVVASVIFGVGMVCSACRAARLPEPKFGPQIDRAFGPEIESTPPDLVPISEIHESPPAGMVWIDGEYQFHSGRWEWVPGAWCTPPKGAAYFAKSQARRLRRPVGKRVARWSEVESRFEEVELGKDVWQWAPGSWYRAIKGGFEPMTEGRGECREPKRPD